MLRFKGKGICRLAGKINPRTEHQIEIKLSASYPRTIPELRWITPIYHPNVSEIGMVCLGAYGTHWVPGLMLDELCVMLWDIARYYNYDLRSPYNREAALWAASQNKFKFPLDPRPLRDLRAALGRVDAVSPEDFVDKPDSNALKSDEDHAASHFHEPPEASAVPELEIRLELDHDENERPVTAAPVHQEEVVFLD